MAEIKPKTLADVDREMGLGKKPAKAGKGTKAVAAKVKAKKEKAAPEPKSAFRVHAMAYNDRTKAYGKCASEEFDDLAEVLSFVEKTIEKGQENGLHEVAIHVR